MQAFANIVEKAEEKSRIGIPTIEKLGLDSTAITQAPSKAQTPGKRLIYYSDKLLGTGTFGTVYRTIRARYGDFFAVKTFKPSAKRKAGDDDPVGLATLRREFTLMKENPHVGVPLFHPL